MVLRGHFDRQLCGCSISFAFSGASEWGEFPGGNGKSRSQFDDFLITPILNVEY